MEKQAIRISFKSNQEAINLYYMIEMKDILQRLLYATTGLS